MADISASERFGKLSLQSREYVIKPKYVQKIHNGQMQFSDLKESHFSLPMTQKGVDMRLGLDIASMAYKQQVNQVILIAGDSDFVPIAKHARREGIDFVMDPMKQRVKPELYIHLDELRNMASEVSPAALQYTEEATV